MLKNEDFCTEFLTTYARLLQTTLDSDRLLTILDSLAAEIEREIPRQAERFGAPSATRWTQQVNYIRSFLKKRESVMVAQIKSTFSLTDEEWEAFYRSVTP